MRAYVLRCVDAGEPARAVARRMRLSPGTVASWCHRREQRRRVSALLRRRRVALHRCLYRVARWIRWWGPCDARTPDLRSFETTMALLRGRQSAEGVASIGRAVESLIVGLYALAADQERRGSLMHGQWRRGAASLRRALTAWYRSGWLPQPGA